MHQRNADHFKILLTPSIRRFEIVYVYLWTLLSMKNYYTTQIMHVPINVTNMTIWEFWPDTEQCLHEKHASKSVQQYCKFLNAMVTFQFYSFLRVGPIDRNLVTPVVGLDPLGGRLLMNIEQCCLKWWIVVYCNPIFSIRNIVVWFTKDVYTYSLSFFKVQSRTQC